MSDSPLTLEARELLSPSTLEFIGSDLSDLIANVYPYTNGPLTFTFRDLRTALLFELGVLADRAEMVEPEEEELDNFADWLGKVHQSVSEVIDHIDDGHGNVVIYSDSGLEVA